MYHRATPHPFAVNRNDTLAVDIDRQTTRAQELLRLETRRDDEAVFIQQQIASSFHARAAEVNLGLSYASPSAGAASAGITEQTIDLDSELQRQRYPRDPTLHRVGSNLNRLPCTPLISGGNGNIDLANMLRFGNQVLRTPPSADPLREGHLLRAWGDQDLAFNAPRADNRVLTEDWTGGYHLPTQDWLGALDSRPENSRAWKYDNR